LAAATGAILNRLAEEFRAVQNCNRLVAFHFQFCDHGVVQQVIEAARDAVASGESPAKGRVAAEALFEFVVELAFGDAGAAAKDLVEHDRLGCGDACANSRQNARTSAVSNAGLTNASYIFSRRWSVCGCSVSRSRAGSNGRSRRRRYPATSMVSCRPSATKRTVIGQSMVGP
jgi:hypothetical protein